MAMWVRLTVITGSVVLIATMIAVWIWGGLGAGGGVASIIGSCVGVIGIAFALLSKRDQQLTVTVNSTGKSSTSHSGVANTGVTAPSTSGGVMSAEATGDAEADGGTSNSGIILT
ncbi:hypothetical protein [Streptomyces rochei]|uniref:hypothetical protein n=1 Tax=Streptomyces rochei TaxID=1928 RepID=UPI0036C86C7F